MQKNKSVGEVACVKENIARRAVQGYILKGKIRKIKTRKKDE